MIEDGTSMDWSYECLFKFAGSKHKLTFTFGCGASTKLLHHSAVSSMPSDVMMSGCCSPSCSLNSLCNE